MAKKVDYQLPPKVLSLIKQITKIFRSLKGVNTNENTNAQIYYEIYESILKINYEVFGYAHLNVANTETMILKRISEEIDLGPVNSSIYEWGEILVRTAMVKEIEVKANHLCLPVDYFYIVCPNGIGDTLIVASYLHAFKEKNQISKICMIVKENQADIPTWFPEIDAYLVSNELTTALVEWSTQKQIWALDNYLFGNITKSITFTANHTYEDFFIDRFRKNVLNLPLTAKRELPVWRKIDLPELEAKYCPNNHTILFLPYAQTSELLPAYFWEQLALKLSTMGYIIFTNVKDEFEKEIKYTKRLCETINNTALFVSSIGHVIGLRSGLCDVLACTQTPIITIDTNLEYFTNWNLARIPEYQQVTSILYESHDDIEPIIEMILSTIKNESIL